MYDGKGGKSATKGSAKSSASTTNGSGKEMKCYKCGRNGHLTKNAEDKWCAFNVESLDTRRKIAVRSTRLRRNRTRRQFDGFRWL